MSASVLIVEDERLVARELGMRLEEHGYRVTARVAAAEEALRSAAEQLPDVVLMDIRLEGEIDGIAAAELLQQRFDVPVIFLTAHSDDETVGRATRSGAAGFLIKPPKERELVAMIEVTLHRHAATRQLRQREKLLASTLNSIGEALVATDASGNIAYMNPVAEALTGWPAEHALGRPLASVVELTYGRGDPTVTDRSGRDHAVADSTSPVVDETGAVTGGVVLLRDVTDQRAQAREREAAVRLTSLSKLAAGIAHEVNNPLTWMVVNLGHLSRSLAKPSVSGDELLVLKDEAVESLEGAERIQRIVRDLSAFAYRTPDHDYCFASDAIHRAVAAISTRVPIVVDLVDAYVLIGEARLVRVLASILANAVDAVGEATTGRIEVTSTRDLNAVTIEIADTGHGMDDETRMHAFEPFFSTKQSTRHAGLGLSVAYGLIAAAGGSITLASTPGTGTTVKVVLPLVDLPTAEPEARTDAEVVRVLVVDDEPAMRKLLVRLLRDHDVSAVESPAALQLIRDGARFELILCDVTMPELDGVQLYQAIHAMDPEQARRIVFLSGGVVSASATEFLRTIPNRILEKPFRSEDVLALVTGAKRPT